MGKRGPAPGYRSKAAPRPLVTAAEAWGEPMPDWVRVLAAAAEATTAREVAARLGYSASVISEVLRRRYAGSPARVEARVRARLMVADVTCPVLGTITTAECGQHAAAPLATTSSARVRLWQACRSCPHGGPQ
ncbi:transcriptional regulator (plasmid) [Tistrella mobilis]|uniref:transcriptional regulator n=1 Tax=Tistrella mobilis TaxID=171437 RepID=UPI003557EE7F